jgi:hypothetical protein
MRESCSCGAAIHVIGYRKALVWRATHLHNADETVIEQTTETSLPVGFTIEQEED